MGRKAFRADISPGSVTQHCQREQVTRDGRTTVVVDSLGLFDTIQTAKVIGEKIKECVEKSVPGPHAILLVISLKARFTEEERTAVEWIKTNFGSDSDMYTIILFTHGDMLGGKGVDEFVSESKDLKRVVHNCGGRYFSLINGPGSDPEQVQKLLHMVEAVVKFNGGQHYTNSMYKEAQRKIEEEERRKKEEKLKKKQEEKRREREEWRKAKEQEEMRKEKEEGEKSRQSKCRAAILTALMSMGVCIFMPSITAVGLATAIASTTGYNCYVQDLFGWD